jgi:hypothetical protein
MRKPMHSSSDVPLTVSLYRVPSPARNWASAAFRTPYGHDCREVQEELEIPASTLSRPLEKLKQVGRLLPWYSANSDALREVLASLYEECCARSRESLLQISR